MRRVTTSISPNVLAFEGCPDNRRGGQERSLFEVLQGVSRLGGRVSLVYLEPGNLENTYRSFVRSLIRIDGTLWFAFRRAHRFWQSVAKLAWRQFHEQWEVLYVNQYIDITLPAVLGMIIQRPVVAHLRLPPPPEGFSRQYRWGLNRCARLIAISRSTAEAHRSVGITAPIEVVYNGTDLSHFTPRNVGIPAGGVIRVLYLGRVLPDKGVHTLVEACKLAAGSMPVRLTVAGNPFPCDEDRAYYARLREQIEKAACKGRFLEHVEDVRPLLADADLLVLPSRWPEPFGRVLIEAMASGVPVVASSVGGIPEILAPDFEDHLVPPDDASALAAAILRHGLWRTNDPELGARMRQHVEQRFDQDMTHAIILRVLADCR